MKFLSVITLVAAAVTGCGPGQSSDVRTSGSSQSAQMHQLGNGMRTASQPPLGVVTNDHGVWDDVDRFIEMRYHKPVHVKAMRQLAIAIQNALIASDTKEKGQETTQAWFRALDCLEQTMGEAWYYESKLFTAEVLNSEARSRAYAIHDSNSAGFYDSEKQPVCDD